VYIERFVITVPHFPVLCDLDHYLSDVLLTIKVLVCLLRLLELEDFVDHRADFVDGDHTVHVIELPDRPDKDTAEDGGIGDKRAWDGRDVRLAGDEANDVNVTSHADAGEGFDQSSCTTDLDDMVDTAAISLSSNENHKSASAKAGITT
jgi:hypothetical protein